MALVRQITPRTAQGHPAGSRTVPDHHSWCPGLALTPALVAIQALGWAPLTDAVVTSIIVPVVTLLSGLQDPVPTGAVLYSVIHRVERGQLAKETHHSYQGQHSGKLQAGQVIGTEDRASGSRGYC